MAEPLFERIAAEQADHMQLHLVADTAPVVDELTMRRTARTAGSMVARNYFKIYQEMVVEQKGYAADEESLGAEPIDVSRRLAHYGLSSPYFL